MTWATKYIGLPFQEEAMGPRVFDCRSLSRQILVTEPRVKIEIDPWREIKTYDAVKAAGKIIEVMKGDDWIEVSRGKLRDFDIAVMWVHRRLFGRETAQTLSHLGVIVAPDRVLHTEGETGSVCVRLSHESISVRLHSFYRHRSLA